jgi:hypothetical protein
MELSLESISGALSTFQPQTGTPEAWNAAYVRVEDYLRAHRIHNRLHQSRLVLRILDRAARRHKENPSLDPTTLAAEEAEHMMETWFSEVLGEQNLPHDRIVISGRVALLLTTDRTNVRMRSWTRNRSRPILRAPCSKPRSRPDPTWLCRAWCRARSTWE